MSESLRAPVHESVRHRKGGRKLNAAGEKWSSMTTGPSSGQRLRNPRKYGGHTSPVDWLTCVINDAWLSLAEVPMNIRDLRTIECGLVLLREIGRLRGSI